MLKATGSRRYALGQRRAAVGAPVTDRGFPFSCRSLFRALTTLRGAVHRLMVVSPRGGCDDGGGPAGGAGGRGGGGWRGLSPGRAATICGSAFPPHDTSLFPPPATPRAAKSRVRGSLWDSSPPCGREPASHKGHRALEPGNAVGFPVRANTKRPLCYNTRSRSDHHESVARRG